MRLNFQTFLALKSGLISIGWTLSVDRLSHFGCYSSFNQGLCRLLSAALRRVQLSNAGIFAALRTSFAFQIDSSTATLAQGPRVGQPDQSSDRALALYLYVHLARRGSEQVVSARAGGRAHVSVRSVVALRRGRQVRMRNVCHLLLHGHGIVGLIGFLELAQGRGGVERVVLLAEDARVVCRSRGSFEIIGRGVLTTVGRRMLGHIAVQLSNGPRRLGRGLQMFTFAGASGAPLASSCRVVGVHFGVLRCQVGVADPHIVDGFEVVTGGQAGRSFRIICKLS